MLAHIVPHDFIAQPTPILPTHLQPPLRTYYPTYGHQFTLWRLTPTNIFVKHPIHRSQTVHDHSSPMPLRTLNRLASTWAWVSTLNVFKFFHFGFRRSQLFNHIPTILQRDVQVAFHFPLNKLAQNRYDVACWHLFFMLPQWCLVLSPQGGPLNIGKCGFDSKKFQ